MAILQRLPAGEKAEEEEGLAPGRGGGGLLGSRVYSLCLQLRAAWEARDLPEPGLRLCGIRVDAEPAPTSAKAKVKPGSADYWSALSCQWQLGFKTAFLH